MQSIKGNRRCWLIDKKPNIPQTFECCVFPPTPQLVQEYTQYGQTVRQDYDADNLLPRQPVMKESRNQKGRHWGYKQAGEEIENIG
ncbi:hypothetical protein [Bifidobacterium longum]|uniref:hypothetical protein n=1 Tax=Bifidobacterium longum TaxID=216816 RepID=UPI001455EC90|nr:hypothetical protein [Bifidobacterium longum]